MKKWSYYNEIDPNCCEWIRQLIKLKQIPDGEVDCRSITEVKPDDIRPFIQAHFFGGIGGFALALRRCGVPDDFPIWTGSTPCQDFSRAGMQKGFKGHRDLWSFFFNLIKECRPIHAIGEQVEAACSAQNDSLRKLVTDIMADREAASARRGYK